MSVSYRCRRLCLLSLLPGVMFCVYLVFIFRAQIDSIPQFRSVCFAGRICSRA